MKVGIDARFITRRPRRGIGSYSLHLTRELVSMASDITFYLYIHDSDAEGELPGGSNVKVRRLSAPGFPAWEQVALPLAARADGVDVLHCLGNTAPIWLSAHIKLVVTLHDVMYLRPETARAGGANWYQRLGAIYRRMVVPLCLRKACATVTVSRYSRDDILEAYPFLPADRVHFTPQSCDPAFGSMAPGAPNPFQGRPFMFALGAEDPRKNTTRLVRAYLSLLDTGIPVDLVIAGYKTWRNSEAFRLVREASAEDRVHFLPYVSLAELVSLYRGAHAFVYPSLYEGFGIPLLEAFSAGCPVIASSTSSIPEVAGDAALYIDPQNEASLAEAIRRLVDDDALRAGLIEKGRRRFDEFTWRSTAAKTLDILKACAQAAS